MESRIQLLVKLVKNAVAEISCGDESTVEKHVKIFKDVGIVTEMHCGKYDELSKHTLEAKLMRLEWYMGSLIQINDSKSMYGINAWLNTFNKFEGI